jgi:GTP cyclohydrolase II
VATTRLPTKWGEFHAIGFQEETYNGIRRLETALALLLGDVMGNVPLVRIHSQCLTGDTLGSLRCDRGEQLDLAMTLIAREQCGLSSQLVSSGEPNDRSATAAFEKPRWRLSVSGRAVALRTLDSQLREMTAVRKNRGD